LVIAVLSGCEPGDVDADPSSDSATSMEEEEPAPRTCIAPPGMGSPQTVAEVVQLVNALERPVTLPCFLESLDRPFDLYASSSQAAGQPAVGERSPRLFIHRGALIMSVVPEGYGRPKLEMSVDVGDRMSVKSEIAFPVLEEVTPTAPYEAIDAINGTTCAACHERESRYPPIQATPAYQSEMYQDDELYKLPMAFAAQHARDCDPSVEPDRCAMLTAIFAHGDLTPWELPRTLKICR
jgi:hypothetical protein